MQESLDFSQIKKLCEERGPVSVAHTLLGELLIIEKDPRYSNAKNLVETVKGNLVIAESFIPEVAKGMYEESKGFRTFAANRIK